MKKATKVELLSAIRRKCLDCSGGVRNEVKGCKIRDCPLYQYRANALRDEEQISLTDALNQEETA